MDQLKKRALSYLGARADEKMLQLIDRALEQVVENSSPKTIHRIFDLTWMEGAAKIDALIDLDYPDLNKHLLGCVQCILMASTLGASLDAHVRTLQKRDMHMAVVVDAVASAYIEKISEEFLAGLIFSKSTYLFSPGYGNLPLAMQHELLRVLDAPRRIGLTANEKHILHPTKSITGVAGIGQEERLRCCDHCQWIENCDFRRSNTRCYPIN